MNRPIVFAAALLVALVSSTRAEAQSVVLNGRTDGEREQGMLPLVLNRAECLAGNGYDYRVSGLANPTLNVEVYVSAAGGTCTQQDRTNGICVVVGEFGPINGAIANMIISPEDLVQVIDGGCTSTTLGAQQPGSVTLHMFQGLANDTSLAPFATQPVQVDLVGPAAPTLTGTSAVSDTSLQINWTDNPETAQDANGFGVFCDPQVSAPPETTATSGGTGGSDAGVGGAQADWYFPQNHMGGGGHGGLGGHGGAGGAGGAGGLGGAGTGGAGTGAAGASTVSTTATVSSSAATSGAGGASGQCPGSLPVGEIPTAAACATVTGNSTTSATVEGLDPTTEYTFAVASVDQVGNYGPLSSDVVCSTPEATTDFFAAYREAGGLGGGGCGCTLVGAPPLSRLAPLGFFVALVLGAARRRSREGA